jgi:hypothetical protein
LPVTDSTKEHEPLPQGVVSTISSPAPPLVNERLEGTFAGVGCVGNLVGDEAMVSPSTPHNVSLLFDEECRNSADEVLPGFLGHALCCPSLVQRLETEKEGEKEEYDDEEDEEEDEDRDSCIGPAELRRRGIRGTADVVAAPLLPPPPAA